MPTRPVDAVVFDMDGTLVDSSTAVPAAYIECVRDIAGIELTPQQVIAGYPLGPPARLLAHLVGRECTTDELDRYHATLAATAAQLVHYAGIAQALDELRAAGIKLAVFTGASTHSCELLLGSSGLAARFDELLGTDLVDHPKPDPAGLLLACERIGVAPERAAYVGDSPLDQQAAQRAGAVAIAAAWGHLYDPASPADVVAHEPADVVAFALGVGAGD